MEIAIVVVMTILSTLGAVAAGYCFIQVRHITRTTEASMNNIEKMVAFIAKGHQLATIIDIKSAKLSVKPEQFEPNKAELLAKIEYQIGRCRQEDPSTWAFVITNHSGLDSFLDHESNMDLRKAITRLRANGDMDGVKALLRDTVEQLGAPKPWRVLDPTPCG